MLHFSLSLLAIVAAWTVRGGLCSPSHGDSAGTDSLSKRTARCVSSSKVYYEDTRKLKFVQCSDLDKKLHGKVYFPQTANFQNQQNGSDGYWTQQEAALVPACRVSPSSAQDVAVAVKELAQQKCFFAVRGGGHMSWAGAANIANGITIDLSAMNGVEVRHDRSITSVGGGARWVDVYLKLDAMNLAVAGGRVFDVGVGGLLTGGRFGLSGFVDNDLNSLSRWKFVLCCALRFCM